ncbi:hypothetical protein BN946_scf184992.g41 [Trametes cinnabarina]|uniref:AAA+ ATPase domain-containing protein n=1 Tax=Pycnoporus cinnabarinus TaxID=5643 RepID=A0A060S3T7_PYCCI|nr:hypothetical protein BN946_scf184992.g41 [Trametes cinnabarina]
MDAGQIIQAVFSALKPQLENITSTPAGGSPDPLSLPRILFLLFSTSAFWDWAKLFLVGALVEVLRRSLRTAWERFTRSFWVTATFEFDDNVSDWLMYWLSKEKVFQFARDIEVSTRGGMIDDLGDNDDPDADYNVVFLPSTEQTYSMWYKRRMLARSPALLRDLVREARKAYKAATEDLIEVSVAEDGDQWRRIAMQAKRPPSSVILDLGVLELVLNDAKGFLSSRKWYADRGIPFRRGYLLHGAPGAGKTSLIHTVAGELGLNVNILSLTVSGLDDNSLKSLISNLPKSCIILMEDIDAAFTRTIKRNVADPEAHSTPARGAFSTNSYGALDPALLRPGRLDFHVEFHLASTYQAKELFKHFYTCFPSHGDEDSPQPVADAEKHGRGPSASSSGRVSSPGPSPMPEGVSSVYAGSVHSSRGSALSAEEAAALAERFAETIPPRTFSMATLQGYLMAYKTRPHAAVDEAAAWVEKKMSERTVPASG